jgi:hypothetical protein
MIISLGNDNIYFRTRRLINRIDKTIVVDFLSGSKTMIKRRFVIGVTGLS